ncbi:MAG: DUF484 family protein [Gammaproteobacteria bacterium]|nr:DUF484 family protein [Gammaproteobacteria bacterium]MYD76355.1 DUF484 family protein [Gammaproteobacteria bacterium]MYJ51197.1 DUF484 family protein [Gammaproteobacteria bacterium]
MAKRAANKSRTALEPKQVVDFLRQHPEFLAENGKLLAKIAPVPDEDGNVFLKKQIETLRERETEQKRKIETILEITKNLEKMQDQLTAFTTALLDQGGSIAHPVEFVRKLLGSEFDIEHVAILEESPEKGSRSSRYDEIHQRVAHRSSICDDRVSTALLKEIFSHDAETIQSSAFVPILNGEDITGVMVLGSPNGERFQPDLGVLYLNRIGSLVGSYLGGRRRTVG